MTVRETFDDSGDPASGSRLDSKFYAADAKEHAQAINENTAAIAAGTAASAAVATAETTSSTSYTDLATTTDSVTLDVPDSGVVLVFVEATGTWVSGSNTAGYVGFALSGANTLAASDARAVTSVITTTPGTALVGRLIPLPGLTPGSTTFKMKYKVNTGSGSFSARKILVIPVP